MQKKNRKTIHPDCCKLFILFTTDMCCYIVFMRGTYAVKNINHIHDPDL